MHKQHILMTPVTYTFSSSIGIVRLTEEQGAITHIALTDCCDATSPPSPLMCEAERQITEYLNGTRQQMDFSIRMEGTPFQLRVWQALQQIPYGSTRSYGELASLLGKPGASRAVGMACNENPLLLIVPCHRVIGANGKLTGFACGLEVKRYLLLLEKRSSIMADFDLR